jgi:hypothetical protein
MTSVLIINIDLSALPISEQGKISAFASASSSVDIFLFPSVQSLRLVINHFLGKIIFKFIYIMTKLTQ